MKRMERTFKGGKDYEHWPQRGNTLTLMATAPEEIKN